MANAFHAIVRGLVQGVSFRYYTAQTARQLSLAGYVRNLPDGTVEVLAEGEEGSLDEFAGWLEHGPRLARVTEVKRTPREPMGLEPPFEVRF